MEPEPRRSALMGRIQGRNTKPERLLRQMLWREGARYRVNYRTIAGRPDLVFVGPRVAVYVDGCFWHGCPDHYVRPRSRGAFWAAKLRGNVQRDSRQTTSLESAGWRVLRYWEHEVFVEPQRLVQEILTVRDGGGIPDVPDWRVIQVDAIDASGEMERVHLVDLRVPESTRKTDRRRHTRKW